VYKDNKFDETFERGSIYGTKLEADSAAAQCRIACVRIEWEEPA
jgi:hypothetical protein